MATATVTQLTNQIAALNGTLSATIAANKQSLDSAKAELDSFVLNITSNSHSLARQAGEVP